MPGKFYKGRSQEKTHFLRLKVFLLLSPLERARSVLTYRTMCSVAGQCAPLVWVFSTSGVHRFLATKPVSCETNKAEPGQILATIVLIWNDRQLRAAVFLFRLRRQRLSRETCSKEWCTGRRSRRMENGYWQWRWMRMVETMPLAAL